MIARPKQLYLVAALLVAIALSFPLQVMVLYSHSLDELQAIFAKITWLNWLVVTGLLVGAYLIFQASRFCLWVAPVVFGLAALNNYWVGKFAGDFSQMQTSLATLGLGLTFTPLLMPSSLAVLKDPKRRWWRTSPRLQRKVPTTLNPFVGDMVQLYTFDISKTGAFLAAGECQETQLPKVGDKIRLCFNVNSMKKIRCEAVVVRIADARGNYPKGLGIRFEEFDRHHLKSFEKFIQSSDYDL